MKLALKYGLLITVCFVAWVVIAHKLVPNPQSLVHSAGSATFVNIVEILGIFLGIRERRRQMSDHLSFKDGLKTGVGIAFVYGLSACLFFAVQFLLPGSNFLAAEAGARNQSPGQAALGAFIGLFFGALLMGLLYSTIISFVFAARQRSSEQNSS